jgi:hypothetical protein
MNPRYKEALDFMEKSNLLCTDFKWMVEVAHDDGSHFIFQNAKPHRTIFGEFEMLLVWTEHCGYHAFFMDDVAWWRQYKQV